MVDIVLLKTYYYNNKNKGGATMKQVKKETIRLNINITKDLNNSIENYAYNMNINKTSAVAILLSNALSNQKQIK